jgi:acetyl-CoA acetyltransferase
MFPSSGGQPVVDGQSVVTANWLSLQLGSPVRFVSGFEGIGQVPGAMILATNAIASGSADVVLVHRALHNPAGRYNINPLTHAASEAQWRAPFGMWSAVTSIALPYQEYLQRYGATREAMAAVVVEARANGARIPWSYWHGKPLTVQDYLDARLVSDPIGVLDCDLPIDGVGCFVLTTAERAADLPHKPVYLLGSAQGHPTGPPAQVHWTLDEMAEGGARTVARLWESAGVRLADVDLPQVYDGFSPLVYVWLEALGYCGRGEAHVFVQDGRICAAEGGLPVLTGGGSLGNGRMHGVPQLLECYLQLAGRAGDRQRVATIAVACHAPPHAGGALVLGNVLP